MGYFFSLFSLSKSETSSALNWSELALLVFGLVLVAGLVGEYKTLKPHSRRMKLFEMLVIVGVLGELLGDGGVFLFSNQLQVISDNEIREANSRALDAKKSAEGAASAADRANAVASEAESHLGDALREATKARRELAEYRAPRLLRPDQQKRIASRISKLGIPFNQAFVVTAVPVTVETGTLAEQILAAVQQVAPGARWFAGGTQIGPMTGTAAVSGVVVFSTRDVRSLKLASVLVDALKSEGIGASSRNSLLGCEKTWAKPDDPACFHVFIVVGPKT